MADIFRMFCNAACTLGDHTTEYGVRQAEVGFTQSDWNLLTQDELWTPDQVRRVSDVITEACSISLSVAGIPAAALPCHYVASVICRLVAPCNRFAAAHKAPRSFDPIKASGIEGPSEDADVTVQQMIALVMFYSSQDAGRIQPHGLEVDPLLSEAVEAQNAPASRSKEVKS